MWIRCHAAALSGILRLGGLRSAPLPASALLALGREGKGPGFSPPSLFPGTLASSESCCCCSSTASLSFIFAFFWGGKRLEGERRCVVKTTKPHGQPQTVKKLINKRPHGLGPKESGPFHLAPIGPINPRPHFVVCSRLPLTAPVAPARRGGERAAAKAPPRSKRREDGRGEPEGPAAKWVPSPPRPNEAVSSKERASEGLAPASATHVGAHEVHFQQEQAPS